MTEAERAELAHDLVSSLDGPPDRDAAQQWDTEISRRLAEVDAGTASLIDRTEFSKRMRIVRILAAAADEAAAWYEGERYGLGAEFERAVDAALDLLEEDIVPLTPAVGEALSVRHRRS